MRLSRHDLLLQATKPSALSPRFSELDAEFVSGERNNFQKVCTFAVGFSKIYFSLFRNISDNSIGNIDGEDLVKLTGLQIL